jgi:phosphate/sulfate permease
MAAVAISLGCVAGAALSYAVGANDVSNSMGTSVGSEALTKRGALVIASIFEAGGVLLIGRLVSDTIRFSIVDPAQHGDSPFLFMLGTCRPQSTIPHYHNTTPKPSLPPLHPPRHSHFTAPLR